MGVVARLRARWYLVAIAAIVGVLVAGASLFHVGPHGLVQKKTKYDFATTQLLIDSDPSTLTNITALSSSGDLAARAPYIAEYATSPSVARKITAAFGHPARIEAAVKSAGAGGATNSPGKNVSIGGGSDTVVLQATSSSPTIQVSAQAGSVALARSLAVATIHGLRRSLVKLQNAQDAVLQASASTTSTTVTSSSTTHGQGTSSSPTTTKKGAPIKIVLRALGAIDASTVVATPSQSKAILYGIGTFVILLLVILVVDNAMRGASGQARRQSPATPMTD